MKGKDTEQGSLVPALALQPSLKNRQHAVAKTL